MTTNTTEELIDPTDLLKDVTIAFQGLEDLLANYGSPQMTDTATDGMHALVRVLRGALSEAWELTEEQHREYYDLKMREAVANGAAPDSPAAMYCRRNPKA